MFRARRRCKILAGVLVEYVEDDFAPTTLLWAIAGNRSRIIILQLAQEGMGINIRDKYRLFCIIVAKTDGIGVNAERRI